MPRNRTADGGLEHGAAQRLWDVNSNSDLVTLVPKSYSISPGPLRTVVLLGREDLFLVGCGRFAL
jgi:hypothetical protein